MKKLSCLFGRHLFFENFAKGTHLVYCPESVNGERVVEVLENPITINAPKYYFRPKRCCFCEKIEWFYEEVVSEIKKT